MGEQLFAEGRVELDSPTSVESWCFDQTLNCIFCVNSITNETLELEFVHKFYFISVNMEIDLFKF